MYLDVMIIFLLIFSYLKVGVDHLHLFLGMTVAFTGSHFIKIGVWFERYLATDRWLAIILKVKILQQTTLALGRRFPYP